MSKYDSTNIETFKVPEKLVSEANLITLPYGHTKAYRIDCDPKKQYRKYRKMISGMKSISLLENSLDYFIDAEIEAEIAIGQSAYIDHLTTINHIRDKVDGRLRGIVTQLDFAMMTHQSICAEEERLLDLQKHYCQRDTTSSRTRGGN